MKPARLRVWASMSVYFKCGMERNAIRHQGIPAMRSVTHGSLQKIPEAFSKGWNQLSMKQTEDSLATSPWWCFKLQHGKFIVFFQSFLFYGTQFRTTLAMYVKRNTGARSCNHSCSGKTMSITQPECVCICSLRYPACNAHATYCHLWPVPLLQYFSTLSHKRQD